MYLLVIPLSSLEECLTLPCSINNMGLLVASLLSYVNGMYMFDIAPYLICCSNIFFLLGSRMSYS